MQVCYTGGKDSYNRGVVWLRFRFHNPKESKARDLCRLVATVMLDALKDPDVQRHGIVIIHVRPHACTVNVCKHTDSDTALGRVHGQVKHRC